MGAMYIQDIDSRLRHSECSSPPIGCGPDAGPWRFGRLQAGGAVDVVARRLEPNVDGLQWHKSDIPVLHRNFDTHGPIDYDDFAGTFTHRFFLANYWKTALALQAAGLPAPSTVVDLGSGSGAATAATLAWMHTTAALPTRVQAVLVDRSARQLAIARDLIANAMEVLPGLSVEVSTLEATIRPQEAAWRLVASGADLIVASHLLTENIDQAPALVDTLIGSMAPSARLLITERPDDEVWQRLPGHGRTLHLSNEGLPLNGFASRREPRPLSVRYCVVSAEREKTMLNLVDRYFRAWREQSVDQLADVFALDATYQEKPFSEPIHSLQGIREYWIGRVLPQVDPRPRVLRLAIDDGSAFVDWQTELTIGLQRKLVSGVMELELDTTGKRIGHLRECYSSRTLS